VKVPALALVTLAALVGCSEPTTQEAPSLPIGLLLSYSGPLAANSVNSERALLMAIEAANLAGGVGGRHLTVIAGDTSGDPRKVNQPARELAAAGAVLFVGPDTTAQAVELKGMFAEQTLILPSFSTADSDIYKPHTWFVMGASPVRVACELHAQLEADGRKAPLVLLDPNGYNNLLGRELGFFYGAQQIFLPTGETSNETTVLPILKASADAYVLATQPRIATSLVYSLAALGRLGDPRTWYLSPTLHTPAFLDTLPKGLLEGAHGVSTGTVAGSVAFRARFTQRWQDRPLDDAYPFYDAGAIAVLALQRALLRDGAITPGAGLARHIIGVTQAGATLVAWDEIGRGLQLLREGREVCYTGLSGTFDFDITGQTRAASTDWFVVGPSDFEDVVSKSECRR
jgi:ABC-type branched-subunit amino acid transport system substrate-binding protein